MQGNGGMHEVRDSDGAGVDVLLLVEHDAKIFVLRHLFELLQVRRGADFVDIAEGHDILGARSIIEVDAALAAAADRSDVQFVVKRLVAERAERWHAAVSAGRHSSGQKRPKKEMASGNIVD